LEQSSKIDFIDHYWNCLSAKGWTSLILHDWERIPHNVVSDIDYVVSGPTPDELVKTLSEYCRETGWQMVQILEHEVHSLCCICFQKEAPFASVSLDVTWDYRRKGIDLISNAVLIDGAWKPPGKAFCVPAPKVEFLYRLVKAAAKAKSLDNQDELVGSLFEIFQSDAEGVNELLGSHAGVRIEGQDERKSFLAKIHEVLGTTYFSKIRSGRAYGFGEISRRIRRVLQPTGLLVGCEAEFSPDTREKVFEILREAFRTFEREERCGKLVDDWVGKRKSVLMLRKTSGKGREDLVLPEGSPDEISGGILGVLERRLKKRWAL
jgi:hypothetical protein